MHEVDPDGNVCHLTGYELPVDAAEPSMDVDLAALLGEDLAGRLQALFDGGPGKDKKITFPAPADKEERTMIHKGIRAAFDGLTSQTIPATPESTAEAPHGTFEVRYPLSKGRQKTENRWPGTRPQYCHFLLYKCNKDTMSAAIIISKLLKVKPMQIMFAGTKDKRGVTVQRVCLRRYTANRLRNLNRDLQGMCLGNFSYGPDPLKLGDLQGNRFAIVLRRVDATAETMTQVSSFTTL